MAPSQASQLPLYAKDEKVLCFHGELLYEAKILDFKHSEENNKKSPMIYFVHYKGWKNTWDDWVSGERVRKLTEENKELAKTLKRDLDLMRKPAPKTTVVKKRLNGSAENSSARDSEERQASLPATGRGKRQREDLDKEEAFHARPEVRIPTPDHLKAILVDDWENVTKNLMLVSLPAKVPANTILDQFYDEEKVKRREGSVESDILDEVVAGLKEYFGKCLGRILLYRFERDQYSELRKLWENGTGEWEGKGAGDCYGGEHLARLIVTMPELIAQTNMDAQGVHRLREEISKVCLWLARHAKKYFPGEYEQPPAEYVEKFRGAPSHTKMSMAGHGGETSSRRRRPESDRSKSSLA